MLRFLTVLKCFSVSLVVKFFTHLLVSSRQTTILPYIHDVIMYVCYALLVTYGVSGALEKREIELEKGY